MDGFELRVSDIVIINNRQYRIIYLSKDMAVMCDMDATSLRMNCIQIQEILDGLHDGSIRREHCTHGDVIDPARLSPTALRQYQNKRSFIREIEYTFGPTYLELEGHQRKEKLDALIMKYEFPRCSA